MQAYNIQDGQIMKKHMNKALDGEIRGKLGKQSK